MANKILILFAHPAPARSEVNVVLARDASGLRDVTLVDLYARYPSFEIDVDHEQDQLLRHDVIVFQHPLYWYSTPSLLKEWQDLVLEYGFAYGPDGEALGGKPFFCALTAGGTAEAYSADGSNQFTLRQLLRPIEQTAALCHMHYLPPFVLFSSRSAVQDGRVAQHRRDWLRTLEALRDGRLDLEQALEAPRLNDDLDALIREGE